MGSANLLATASPACWEESAAGSCLSLSTDAAADAVADAALWECCWRDALTGWAAGG